MSENGSVTFQARQG